MNEKYLLGAYESFGGETKLGVDFKTWVAKIQNNEQYKKGMFNHFGGSTKLKVDYTTWNSKVFGAGDVKKKEESTVTAPKEDTELVGEPKKPITSSDLPNNESYDLKTQQKVNDFSEPFKVPQTFEEITSANKHVPFVKRALDPNYKAVTNEAGNKYGYEAGSESTHRLSAEIDSDGKSYVFPTMFPNEDGTWKEFDNTPKGHAEALEYAKTKGEVIPFDDIKEAVEYSQNGLINHNPNKNKKDPVKDVFKQLPPIEPQQTELQNIDGVNKLLEFFEEESLPATLVRGASSVMTALDINRWQKTGKEWEDSNTAAEKRNEVIRDEIVEFGLKNPDKLLEYKKQLEQREAEIKKSIDNNTFDKAGDIITERKELSKKLRVINYAAAEIDKKNHKTFDSWLQKNNPELAEDYKQKQKGLDGIDLTVFNEERQLDDINFQIEKTINKNKELKKETIDVLKEDGYQATMTIDEANEFGKKLYKELDVKINALNKIDPKKFTSQKQVDAYNKLATEFNKQQTVLRSISENKKYKEFSKNSDNYYSFQEDFNKLLTGDGELAKKTRAELERQIQRDVDYNKADDRERALGVITNSLGRFFVSTMLLPHATLSRGGKYGLVERAVDAISDEADKIFELPSQLTGSYSDVRTEVDGNSYIFNAKGEIQAIRDTVTNIELRGTKFTAAKQKWDNLENKPTPKREFNKQNMAGKLTNSVTDMAALIYGGNSLSKGMTTIAGLKKANSFINAAGLTYAGMAMEYNSLYKEAVRTGEMTRSQANKFATVTSFYVGALENISPQHFLLGRVGRKSITNATVQLLKDGVTFKKAVGQVLKSQFNSVPFEVVQEISQEIADRHSKSIFNSIHNKDLFETEITADEAIEIVTATALTTFIANSKSSLNTATNLSYLQEEAINMVLNESDAGKYGKIVDLLVENKKFTKEEGEAAMEMYGDIQAVKSKLDENQINDKDKALVVAYMARKVNLERQKKEYDKAFHFKFDELIKMQDGFINEIITGKADILNSQPDGGIAAREEAAKELIAEHKGDKEFNITDEQISERAIEKLNEEASPLVSETIDDNNIYVRNGKSGIVTFDGQQVVFKETDGTVHEMGTTDDLIDTDLEQFGINKEETLNIEVAADNSVTVEGKKYVNNYSKPLSAIEELEDGYSVTLEDEKGRKRTFRGQRAEQIVYQYKLKELEENGTEQQIQEANQLADEAIRVENETRKTTPKRKAKRTSKGKKRKQRTLKTIKEPVSAYDEIESKTTAESKVDEVLPEPTKKVETKKTEPKRKVTVQKWADGLYRIAVDRGEVENLPHTFNDTFETLEQAQKFGDKVAKNNKTNLEVLPDIKKIVPTLAEDKAKKEVQKTTTENRVEEIDAKNPRSKSGRKLTPIPTIKYSPTGRNSKKVDKLWNTWLIENALAEVKNNYQRTLIKAVDVNNFSEADGYMLNELLFGNMVVKINYNIAQKNQWLEDIPADELNNRKALQKRKQDIQDDLDAQEKNPVLNETEVKEMQEAVIKLTEMILDAEIKPAPKKEAAPEVKVKPPVVEKEDPAPKNETPQEKNRRLGQIIVDGVKYVRQAILSGAKGLTGKVKFSETKIVDFEYQLVESENLQSSHRGSTRNLNHFIPEAQPKERIDKSSQLQSDTIAQKMNFDEVSDNTLAYSGAPIVNERGEVIQGNNRAEGIRKHYNYKLQQYKKALIANAAKFGFTAEQINGMKNPVLVRVVKVSDTEAIKLGNQDVKDIETGGNRRVDAVASSKLLPSDAKQQIAGILFEGISDKTLNNRIREKIKPLLNLLSKYFTPAQIDSIQKRDGTLSNKGIVDLEDLVKHFLFEGGITNLPRLFESLHNTVQKGIWRALPSILKSAESQNILKEVQGAIEALADYQNSNVSFNQWMYQGDFYNPAPFEKYTPEMLVIAKFLDDAVTQKEIMTTFELYTIAVEGVAGTLFATEGTPAIDKKTAIKKLFDNEFQEKTDTSEDKSGDISSDSPTSKKGTEGKNSEESDRNTSKQELTDEPLTEETRKSWQISLQNQLDALDGKIAKNKEDNQKLTDETKNQLNSFVRGMSKAAQRTVLKAGLLQLVTAKTLFELYGAMREAMEKTNWYKKLTDSDRTHAKTRIKDWVVSFSSDESISGKIPIETVKAIEEFTDYSYKLSEEERQKEEKRIIQLVLDWAKENEDRILDDYLKMLSKREKDRNVLDPDALRENFHVLGYTAKNIPLFRKGEKHIVSSMFNRMMDIAEKNGNKTITFLTGTGGSGKSFAVGKRTDLEGKGLVYDSAFNSINSLSNVVEQAKARGFDIHVVFVYNDAAHAWGNTLDRGLNKGRFMSLAYFIQAFGDNQNKVLAFEKKFEYLKQLEGYTNTNNRPHIGMGMTEARLWDYQLSDAQIEELLEIIVEGRWKKDKKGEFTKDENGNKQRENGLYSFTEDELTSIAADIQGVKHRHRGRTPKMEEYVRRIENRLRRLRKARKRESEAERNRRRKVARLGVNSNPISEITQSNLIKKFDEILENLNKTNQELTEATRDMHSFFAGIGIAGARTVILAMKAAVKTAKTTVEIIEAGIKALKTTEWYQNLTDFEQEAAVTDFTEIMNDDTIDFFQEVLKNENKGKVNQELRVSRIKETVQKLRQKFKDIQEYQKAVVRYIKEKLDAEDVPTLTKRDLTTIMNKIIGTNEKKFDRVINEVDFKLSKAKLKRFTDAFLNRMGKPNSFLKKMNGKLKASKVDNDTRKAILIIQEYVGKSLEEISAKENEMRENIDDYTSQDLVAIQIAKQFSETKFLNAMGNELMSEKPLTKNNSNLSREEIDAANDKRIESAANYKDKAWRSMESAVEELDALINIGAEGLKSQIQIEALRLKGINEQAVGATTHSLSGKTKSDIQNEQHARKSRFFSKIIGDKIETFKRYTSKISTFTFEYLLAYIDRADNYGKGFLHTYFYSGDNGFVAANSRFKQATRDLTNKLSKDISKIIGKNFNNIFSDYYHERKFNSVVNTGISLLDENGERKPYEKMSLNQALYVHLVSKMSENRIKLAEQGWDSVAMGQLETFLGEKQLKLSEYITDLLKNRYERYNEVHKEILRTDMGQEEGYFPTKYDSMDFTHSVNLGGEMFILPSVSSPHLIAKVKNNNRIDVTQNAMEVLHTYLDSMERFYHYARFTKDINSVLSNKNFRNNVKAWDKQAYSDLIKLTKALLGNREDFKTNNFSTWFYSVNAAIAASYIAYKGFTALKQILSLPATSEFADDIHIIGTKVRIPMLGKVAFMSKIVLNMNPYSLISNYRFLIKNSVQFAERLKRGNIGDEFIQAMFKSSKSQSLLTKFFLSASKIGILPNKLVDAFTISIAGKVLYDQQFKKYRKVMSEQDARIKAIRDFEIAFKITQQSADMSELSPVQIQKDVVTSLFVPFKNAQFGYYRRIASNSDNIIRRFTKAKDRAAANGASDIVARAAGLKAVMGSGQTYREIENFLLFSHGLPLLWQWVASGMPYLLTDWDDDDADEMKRAAILGVFDGVFAVNDMLMFGYNSVVLGKRWRLEKSILLTEMEDAFVQFKTAYDEAGEFNEDVLLVAMLNAMKLKGINFDTIKNIYEGTEEAIQAGTLRQQDAFKILNTTKEIQEAGSARPSSKRTAAKRGGSRREGTKRSSN